MDNELEKYVNEHRDAFDDYQIDEVDKLKLWSLISEALPVPSKKVIPLWKKSVFSIAASVVLFICCGLTYMMFNQNNLEDQIVNQELYDIDGHYKLLVNNQIALIKNSSVLSKADQDDFLLLIEDLDNEYNNLKTELKERINNQKIIEAIIANYRKKIDLMENLLQRTYSNKNKLSHEELVL